MNSAELATYPDERLARIDPVVLNLEVAKGVPQLAHLDIGRYRRIVDAWAHDIRLRLPDWEAEFHKTPWQWDNDINTFRAGQMCFYTDQFLGIRYKDDQKGVRHVWYTDPSDLFLDGVIDTRRGTCGNMATLHLALGWRLGWPVSLATARWHQLLRFDNGQVAFNIESSNTDGGFRKNPDSYYVENFNVAPADIPCGADLTFLRPRQVLGVFMANRARHWWDVSELKRAQEDYWLASFLFPEKRLYREQQMQAACWAKARIFNPRPPTQAEQKRFFTTITVGVGSGEEMR